MLNTPSMLRCCALLLTAGCWTSSFAQTASDSNDQVAIKSAATQLMAFTSSLVHSLDGQALSDQATAITVTMQGKAIVLMVKLTPLSNGESIQATAADSLPGSPYREFHCVLNGSGTGSSMTVMAITASTTDGASISGYRRGEDLEVSYESPTVHGTVVLPQGEQPTMVQSAPVAQSDKPASLELEHLDWQSGLSLEATTTPHDTTPTQITVSPEAP